MKDSLGLDWTLSREKQSGEQVRLCTLPSPWPAQKSYNKYIKIIAVIMDSIFDIMKLTPGYQA